MSSPPRVEPKLLYRRLDSLFGALDPRRPQRELLESFLEQAFATLKEDLRLRSGMLYAERRDAFELLRHVGERDGLAEEMSAAVPPLSLLLKHRAYIFVDTESWVGQPDTLQRAAAAIVVGRRPDRYAFFFLLSDGWVREELDFALNTVRAALGSRLVDERVRGSVQQAAEIQQSLLVEEPPAFPGYDIACRSIPTEEVGGDFYDFYDFTSFEPDMLGIAIGDASGHGLPAALLVRDVVTGLRMGMERELKVTHVFQKLNRVINRSTLSSRFVSVFYGELERNGNLIFVNAGHPPPLLISDGGVARLETGGTVVGALAEARFRRGIVRMAPGSMLVLATDGILERRGPAGELGEEGIVRIVRGHPDADAEGLIEALFSEAYEYGAKRPWEDDATAVVVRKLPRPPV